MRSRELTIIMLSTKAVVVIALIVALVFSSRLIGIDSAKMQKSIRVQYENKNSNHYRRTSSGALPTDDPFILDLLNRMTLAEKVGQMFQLDIASFLPNGAAWGTDIDWASLEQAVSKYGIGSLFNNNLNVKEWLDLITNVQQIARNSSTSGIPILYGLDSVHGANYVIGATLFPQPIGSGATFNPDLAYNAGVVTAKDTRAVGIPWAFAPNVEVARNVIWPRTYELYSEDPYLNSVMVTALVNGLTGGKNATNGGIANVTKVAACPKHFVGYCDPHSGKDHTNTETSFRMVKEILLPPFQAGIDAGAQSVMASMGSIDYVPISGSKKYLTDVLRTQMGFDGLLVSDYQAIQQLTDMYKVAPTYRDGIKMSIDAGMDMVMWATGYDFVDLLIDLVQKGEISEARIDQSVAKILSLKKELGLFDNPFPDRSSPFIQTIGCAEDRAKALATAHESITLLKNEGNLLPLDKAKLSSILITGPSGNSLSNQNGGWSIHWQGAKDDEYPFGSTLLDGVKNIVGSGVTVNYVEGANTENITNLDEAIAAAKQSDVIIIAAGEAPYAEIYGDINDMNLAPAQMQLIQAMHATGKPVVLVLIQGRPRIITWAAANIPAIVYAYLPGSEGGQAIADILFGVVNPSGKLPITYPQFPNDINVPYWHINNAVTTPQWEFGFGLSYTTFAYSNLSLSATSITAKQTITASVTVTNTGSVAGKESVLLYVSDLFASIAPAVKRLRKFQKVELAPGASQTLQFTLVPSVDMSFINADLESVVEPGEFQLSVGGLSASFTVTA